MVQEELVNKSLVQAWAWWALVWLTVFPFVGILVSIQFHNPEFLGGIAWFTFGRLRSVHLGGVLFGSFTSAFIALLYYFVPRLCGTPLYKVEWGWWLLWIWNAFLMLGSLSLCLGYMVGVEYAEYEWPLNLMRFIVVATVALQVVGTILRRHASRVYVSLWYTLAAGIWTVFNLSVGGVLLPYGPVSGANSAAIHGLYMHNLVGLWITPAGLATIYYFLPLSAKNALYSHKLSLLGFWSFALFYPMTGTHHYLYSPIPHWTQTVAVVHSLWMIIPVLTVIVNFFGTMLGRWGTVLGGGGSDNYAAKFLMIGVVYYFIGSVQGSIEGLHRLQQLTHFNDFVVGHAHLTVFGVILWVVGGLYYVWPRLTGRQLWSDRLASWHLWLTISGFTAMVLGLTIQGFIQGAMLDNGADFVDSVKEMQPWWVTRTIVGTIMDVALGFMAYNFYKTVREGQPFEGDEREPLPKLSRPSSTAPRKHWLENPSTVGIVAGVIFFVGSFFILGALPWLQAATRTTAVADAVTGLPVRVNDYSPLEQRGRQVYIRDGCWQCHSQYIRPVTGETLRWGPVSQIGESAYDRPHMFSTRRIGPDLTRVGRKYGDDWHIAHLWNPQDVVADSIMPRFPWLFEQAQQDTSPQLTEDGKALVAYLQRLGTSIGDWRAGSISTRISGAAALPGTPQAREELLSLGKEVYERRCVGCHGAKGDGKGPSAMFLTPKPRDFTTGLFKFRSTPGKDSLPTDADLYLTVTHGLWGTAMPSMQETSDRQRWAVIQYLKTFSDRWAREPVGQPIAVPAEPAVTTKSLERGKTLFLANCALCHGDLGKADGALAQPGMLLDDWGEPIKPAHLSLPAGSPGGVKLGHGGPRLYQEIVAGFSATPMPPFDSLTEEEVWDLVHYVQSLRVTAQEEELVAAGLREQDRQTARERIWAAMSGRASDVKPIADGDPRYNVVSGMAMQDH